MVNKSAAGAGCSACALPLGPRDQADPMVSEVWVVGRAAKGSLCQPPWENIASWGSRILEQGQAVCSRK